MYQKTNLLTVTLDKYQLLDISLSGNIKLLVVAWDRDRLRLLQRFDFIAKACIYNDLTVYHACIGAC